MTDDFMKEVKQLWDIDRVKKYSITCSGTPPYCANARTLTLNSSFSMIGAAPTMMTVIKALVAEREVMHERIERLEGALAVAKQFMPAVAEGLNNCSVAQMFKECGVDVEFVDVTQPTGGEK